MQHHQLVCEFEVILYIHQLYLWNRECPSNITTIQKKTENATGLRFTCIYKPVQWIACESHHPLAQRLLHALQHKENPVIISRWNKNNFLYKQSCPQEEKEIEKNQALGTHYLKTPKGAWKEKEKKGKKEKRRKIKQKERIIGQSSPLG